MTDQPTLPPGPADDGELLSAYLDGELDGGAAAALESRLEAEPELAQRLESTRAVVEALAGLHATPPEGFAERLGRRLEAERAVPALDAARSARHARRPRWASLGTVAAAAAAVAVLGGLAVTTVLPRGADDFALESADAPGAAMEPVPEADRDAALDDSDEETAEGFAAGGTTEAEGGGTDLGRQEDGRALPAAPAVVEAGVELAGDDEARAYFRDLEDAAAFLGIGPDEAEQLAPAFTVALRHAEEFSSGLRPDRCLDEVSGGEDAPVVPVRVEAVSYGGVDALAYLVASASTPEAPLDRVAGWIVEAEGCATRLYSPVNPEP